MEKNMENEYPDSLRIFPNNENPDSAVDVSVFFRVKGEEHKLRIYKNRNKVEGDNRPTYLVKLTLNGEDLEANSWEKVSKEGKKYFSGTPKPPDVGYQSQNTTGTQNTAVGSDTSFKPSDEEIPF
tara:strand:+ start:106 stop:480 length:375 start_codon:yes stop_codon:yes gene_type:complete